MRAVLIVCLLGVLGALAKPTKKEAETSCGYDTCHPVSDTKINVHLVPHSHDDVGWLKTVDQYYYGAKTTIQRAGVQYTITTATEALRRNKNRRYVQVETAFFRKWWNDADETLREDFRNLVNNGQIEMINGGISMNDEACTNYQSTIDQYTWGLRFLNETLGKCGIPKIGWQIDPFGHSREQASLFAQFGFNGFFFARLDENDRKNRKANKRLDYLWQGSVNLENTEIFGNVFPTGLYFPANDLHWDVGDTDDPVIDDPESPDYNVPKFIESVKNSINEYKEWYPTNNVLIPMGGDFQFQSAEMNFINMDRLIKAFQNDTDLNVIYSTPSCYIKAVNDAKPTLRLKTDDFFPYGNSDHEYWAGYFSSRPNSKRYERLANNILQGTKQLAALVKLLQNDDHEDDLDDLREEMGIMQHHDAITGTEKQHVTSDYVRRLDKGVKIAERHLDEILGLLLKKDDSATLDSLNLHTCLLANVSICSTSEGNSVIAVYNPLSRTVQQPIRVPVGSEDVKVYGSDLSEVPSDVLPAIAKFDYVKVEDGTPSSNDLVFVTEVPAFGIKLFYLEQAASKAEQKAPVDTGLRKFGDDSNGFEIDSTTNLLKSVTVNGKTVEVTQEFLYYQSSNKDINSGAYLFRPLENTEAISISDKVTIESTTSTDTVDEVVQVFNDYVRQIIRVYKTIPGSPIEFDWLVGPIPVDEANGIGSEIISRFTVKDFANNKVFYTDSNGRELIRRELNTRPDYEYDPSFEPIASNYYPVTSKILIRDETKNLEVAVLNDRSQAGSSLNEGQLELMVHRRVLKDDSKGVDEALNEIEFGQGVVVRGTHYLILGDLSETKDGKSPAAIERSWALRKLLAPLVLVGSTSQTKEDISEAINLELAPVDTELPENVNVLTLEPWSDDSYVLRLEHILEKTDDETLSTEVTVDLNKILKGVQFSSIRETTLAGNQWLEEYEQIEKFTWISDEKTIKAGYKVDKTRDSGSEITLKPMQFRTFIVKV